jgi:hypothetical protein
MSKDGATGGPINPGGVGICLSGGGSRAMGAAMGQLQALEALTTAAGDSLFSQVLAMSTVSGGGWVGIPFTFLPSSFSDSQFLGSYTEPANLTDGIITASPAGWLGGQVSSGFSLPDLATKAVYLSSQGVPSSQLWQTLMGLHFLQPYGLFPVASDFQPNTLFSLDSQILGSQVTGPNPSLADVPAYLVAQVSGQQRPYLLGVASMFVTLPIEQVQALVPVQSTPVLTGILPTPVGGVDGNGLAVGGGAIGSFSFNSTYESSGSDGTATIQQSGQWSLMDIVGTSSAAFAASLESELAKMAQSSHRFAAALRANKDSAAASLAEHGYSAADVVATLEDLAVTAETGGMDAVKGRLGGIDALSGLIPTYDYWSPGTPPSPGGFAQQEFADGGSLDNSGVTSVLFYPDVSTVIAFINTENALTQDSNDNIAIDESVSALFGFQKYDGNASPPYAPLSGAPTSNLRRFNQIFPSADFQPLLDGLWQSTGGDENMAPIFTQQLVTVANDWFGIEAGRDVTVLWVYLGMSEAWFKEVKDFVVKARIDFELTAENFPHYDTLKTQRTPVQMNLLSNLTAWTVMQNSDAFTALFKPI